MDEFIKWVPAVFTYNKPKFYTRTMGPETNKSYVPVTPTTLEKSTLGRKV